MEVLLLVLGSWLLLNALYVLVVIPSRRGKPSSALRRAIDTLRHLIQGRRHPPS